MTPPRRCAALVGDGNRCPHRPRPGSRFCGVPGHLEQRPQPPLAWLTEGRARRAPVGSSVPRLHLLVMRSASEGGDVLLCTERPAGHRAAPVVAHVCRRCRLLALEAVARGEVEPDHLRRWDLGEPNVDEVLEG